MNLSRQKLESLGILAGGIAHDFNNLLGTILADAELALSELGADAAGREEIQRIRTVAIRASEIVRELMVYAGREKATSEPVDVSRVVEEMLELLKVSLPKTAVLKTDFDRHLPTLAVNASQLRQVVMNLIINAAEAMGAAPGYIRVATSRVHSRNGANGKRRSAASEGEYVCLEVSDTGCGMSQEAQARIFEPAFTTKVAGRGLGLAVVKTVVAGFGGKIHVVSTPGKGTRFEVLFPCGSRASGPDQAAAASALGDQGAAVSGRLLLVEDESGLRVSTARMLRKRGLKVVEAGDGWAAMDVIRDLEKPIDLILLDMTIPGAPSHDVLAEAQRLRPESNIILTTAYGRETAGPSFDVPQLKGFIRKPYQFAELMDLIRKTLTVEPRSGRRAGKCVRKVRPACASAE